MEKDETALVYNKRVSIKGIPEDAQDYVVNGRSPLEWAIDRYQVKTDKATGIVNDPNEYSNDSRYNLPDRWQARYDLVRPHRHRHETANEVEISKPASWPTAWRAN